MSEEMKTSDVFALPLKLAVNKLAIIDRFDRVVGWSDAFTGEVARDRFVHAVNEHGRLTEENQKLRELVKSAYIEGSKDGYRTGLDDGQTWSSNKNNLDSEDDWQHSDVKQLLEQTK